jgi:hypothetical protein
MAHPSQPLSGPADDDCHHARERRQDIASGATVLSCLPASHFCSLLITPESGRQWIAAV